MLLTTVAFYRVDVCLSSGSIAMKKNVTKATHKRNNLIWLMVSEGVLVGTSISVIKCHDQGDLERERSVWLMVSEGKNPWQGSMAA